MANKKPTSPAYKSWEGLASEERKYKEWKKSWGGTSKPKSKIPKIPNLGQLDAKSAKQVIDDYRAMTADAFGKKYGPNGQALWKEAIEKTKIKPTVPELKEQLKTSLDKTEAAKTETKTVAKTVAKKTAKKAVKKGAQKGLAGFGKGLLKGLKSPLAKGPGLGTALAVIPALHYASEPWAAYNNPDQYDEAKRQRESAESALQHATKISAAPSKMGVDSGSGIPGWAGAPTSYANYIRPKERVDTPEPEYTSTSPYANQVPFFTSFSETDPYEIGQGELENLSDVSEAPTPPPSLPSMSPISSGGGGLRFGGNRGRITKPPKMGNVSAMPVAIEPPLLDQNRFTSLAGGKYGNWAGAGEPNPNPSFGVEPKPSSFNYYQDMVGEQGPPVPTSSDEESSSVFDEYFKRWGQRPEEQDYKASFWRKLLGGLAGMSTGWQQGAGAGLEVGQRFVREPYERAVEDWQSSLDELEPLMKQEVYKGVQGERNDIARMKVEYTNQTYTELNRIKRLELDLKKINSQQAFELKKLAQQANDLFRMGQVELGWAKLQELREHNDALEGISSASVGNQKRNIDSLIGYREAQSYLNKLLQAMLTQQQSQGSQIP